MGATPQQSEVVVVTGASAGLGRAIVEQFARRGARIGLIARGQERLDQTRAAVEALGGQALVLPADVADAEAIENAAERVERELGPIDVWINNAMTSVFSPVKEMTAEEFKRVTDVTYLGYVYGTLAALRRMLPRDRGQIVQIGSALAHRSIPLQAAYCASKHAILGFTASLRSELIHDGSNVTITMVQMPAMNTPQFEWVKSRLPKKPQPVPPIFQPEVCAEAVVWAVDNYPGREMSVGLPTLKAILGNKVIPGALDAYLADHAYSGQQTEQDESPDRPSNLWEPAPGDWGARGRFDARSRATPDWQLWLRTHPAMAVAGAALVGVAIGALTGGDGENRAIPVSDAERVAADRSAADIATAEERTVGPGRTLMNERRETTEAANEWRSGPLEPDMQATPGTFPTF